MKARIHLPSSPPIVFKRVLAACAVAGFIAVSARAADSKAAIDPQADEWLKRMGDYLGQAPFFSVNVEIWQDVDLASGQRVQADRTVQLQVRRPNRLHAQVHSTHRDREMIYDGESVTLFNRAQNFYGTAHASGPLDEAMDTASEKFGINIPLEDFIRSDPHKDSSRKPLPGWTSGR